MTAIVGGAWLQPVNTVDIATVDIATTDIGLSAVILRAMRSRSAGDGRAAKIMLPIYLPRSWIEQFCAKDSIPYPTSNWLSSPVLHLLLSRQRALERRGFRRIADVDHELAGVHLPVLRGFIPVGEGTCVEVQRDVLCFAGG